MSYLGKRQLELRPLMDKMATLKEEITKFESKREHAQKNAEEAEKFLVSLRAQIQDIELILENAGEQIADFAEYVRETVNRGIQVIQDVDKGLENHFRALEAIQNKVSKAQATLTQIERLKMEAEKRISEEDARLERKRVDIRIYEDRLRKKLQDAGMEDVIKLVFE